MARMAETMDIRSEENRGEGRKPFRKKLLIFFSTFILVLGFTASGIANNLASVVGGQLSEAQSLFILGVGMLGFARYARKSH